MSGGVVLAALLISIALWSSAGVVVHESATSITLSNRFLQCTISTTAAVQVVSLSGDYYGESKYGDNVLSSQGVRLEWETEEGDVYWNSDDNTNAHYNIVSSEFCVKLMFPNVTDSASNPSLLESWLFTLCNNDRSITWTTSGVALNDMKVRSIRHAAYATPLSITAFYNNGVIQMMSAAEQRSHFGSAQPLHRAYAVGIAGTLDLTINTTRSVLLNSDGGLGFFSGVQELLAGSNFAPLDEWTASWDEVPATIVFAGTAWTSKWTLSPTQLNFPSSHLPPTPSPLSEVARRDAYNIAAMLTGIYSNAVGCLCTYPNEVTMGVQVNQIATSLRTDNYRGYNHTYNYFDPDNFIALSAILYSDDAYLQEQVRLIIERTGEFINRTSGMVPHHFEGIMPYYLALSGATQTGPNTFWVKTALRYADVTGNIAWLRNYLPTLRLASSFVFDLIDQEIYLLYAPGSLMIDVFIRNNYTSDSNAMVVGFLKEFATAERLVGSVEQAIKLEEQAERVKTAMNKYLWNTSQDDHYITQLNIDGTTRDFIDYDSNFIAIAHNVADERQSRAIQRRIDGGSCSAAAGGGAQFVSEMYYGADDTTNGNQGDSYCSMGRIALFDALGRKRFGTLDDYGYFSDHILSRMQSDLMAYPWMHERYGCDGRQQTNRTMYYFEYPSIVSMLLREVEYGIDVGLSVVKIAPFMLSEFIYCLGNMFIYYSQTRLELSIPGQGKRYFHITGLAKSMKYKLFAPLCDMFINATSVYADENGVVEFVGPVEGETCVIYLNAME